MPVQVWGTFSVTDHLAERPFVADVLLYDRLVVPVPTGEDRERWEQQGREPQKLETLLGILGGDLARAVPWGGVHRAAFEERWRASREAESEQRFAMANAVQFDDGIIRAALEHGVPENPMHVTRLILFGEGSKQMDREFFAEHPDVAVESVAAFPEYVRFDRQDETAPGARPAPAPATPSAILGWEFLVPKDDRRSDEDLLANAADLARTESFRRTRAEFHEARRALFAQGGVPQTLQSDLERRLDSYRDECAKAQTRTGARYAFWVASTVTAAGALVFPPLAIAGVIAGGAGFLVDQLLPAGEHDAYSRPAALVHDARRHFGWEDL
jgi:hypothetical protein